MLMLNHILISFILLKWVGRVNYLLSGKGLNLLLFRPLWHAWAKNMTRLLPLQVTAINSSMYVASWAPTSRWRQLNRTWWHDAPGSLNTPSPSHFLTQWVQRCFVWWWIWLSSSSTVYLSSLHQSVKKRNVVKVQRKPHPRSLAAKPPASWVTAEVIPAGHETHRQVGDIQTL